MGMPKGVFSSQTSKIPRRPSSTASAEAAVVGEMSTSPHSERRLSFNGNEVERRGRKKHRSRKASSRASSVKSRSSSIGSLEEDDRERRRQLIRASRPGGTGMVTLPDGRRIRARRVGEEDTDDDENVKREWGFARLAREARRQEDDDADHDHEPSEAVVGDKRASDDEREHDSEFERAVNDADGLGLIKRRRREREEAGTIASSTDVTTPDAPDVSRDAVLATSKSIDSPEILSPDLADLESKDEFTVLPTSAAMKSSDAVRAPKRSNTLPNGPITLSASQAAEVRRRHEQEVAALGAEVLQNLAKAKKAKQQQQQQQQPIEQKDPTIHPSGTSHVPSKPIPSSPGPSHKPVELKDRGRERTRPIRSSTTDESSKPGSRMPLFHRHRGSNKQGSPDGSNENRVGPPSEIGPMISEKHERPSTPLRERAHTFFTSSPRMKNEKGSFNQEDDSTQDSFVPPISGDSQSVHARTPSASMDIGQAETAVAKEQSNTVQFSPPSSFLRSQSNRSTRSSRTNDSIRDVPSPHELPRRPDRRGYSIVPLPISQLGRRPDRPREGRFWQSDIDDEDESGNLTESGEEQEEITITPVSQSPEKEIKEINEDEDEEEAESVMDPEELAEEERRTAQQKQRATTRAAGAEMVSSQAKSKSPARGELRRKISDKSNSLASASLDEFRASKSKGFGGAITIDDLNIAPPKGRRNSHSVGRLGHRNLVKSSQKGENLRSTASTSMIAEYHSQSKKNKIPIPSLRKDPWNDISDGDDDGGRKVTHQVDKGKSGPLDSGNVHSNYLSSPVSDEDGRNVGPAKQSLIPNGSNLSKGRGRKSEDVQRRAISHEHDESLDYGWPKSLQGSSLY